MPVAAQYGRMRWWYESIADWMLVNPGGSMADCARDLGRGISTVYLVTATDVFKRYFEKRRAEYNELHDLSIISKTTKIAESVLDLQLEVLEKKRDKIPLSQLIQIGDSALSRLGYGAKANGGGVTVNVGPNAGAHVVPVARETLAQARDVLRAAEQRKIVDITPSAVRSEQQKEVESCGTVMVDASDGLGVEDAPSGS